MAAADPIAAIYCSSDIAQKPMLGNGFHRGDGFAAIGPMYECGSKPPRLVGAEPHGHTTPLGINDELQLARTGVAPISKPSREAIKALRWNIPVWCSNPAF